MAKVTSTIKLNQIRIKQLDKAAVRALEKTAEALHDEIVQEQVIPRMDGVLQGEKFFVDTSKSTSGNVSLVHEGPYARRLYFHPEYNFHHESWEEDGLTHEGNPNAKGKWFEDWLSGGKYENFAEKAFRKFYKKESGV